MHFTPALISLFLLMLFQIETSAQLFTSYYKGQKVSYKVANDKLLIVFKEDGGSGTRLSRSSISRIENLGAHNVSIATLNKPVNEDGILELINEVEGDEVVSYASPILLSETGEEIGGLTNQFMVRLKNYASKSDLDRLIGKARAKVTDYQFDSRTYFISVEKGSLESVLSMANRFYETGLFEFAEPDFIFFVEKSTNDQFFNQQWAINNTGQNGGTSGADMKVLKAWETTMGCNAVRIAILDDGVQLTHPDLIDNLVAGFDAAGGGTNGGPGGGDGHGTACAGIAGADADNTIGVAGIANNCRLVPVRVFTGTSTTTDLATAGWMAAGIDWAWQNNRSDVLSMSWRIAVGQGAIDQAINRAATQGRNGLGCVLLVASGNDNSTTLTFPASNPQVIAVGASTPCDTRKSTTSCDGETNWGSNFGTGLDIVAPGVKIYTTDRRGTAGFNTTPGDAGDYVSNFNGTSAATPNAAGVAALILSANPTLTANQVRQILESTTDKIAGYTFNSNVAGQPNGTWNNEVGYGRVNASRAVAAAVGGPIDGPNLVCATGTFSLPAPPPGSTVTWSSSNSSGLSINPSTGLATRQGNFNGSVTITATISAGVCGSVPINRKIWVGTPLAGLALDGSTLCCEYWRYVEPGVHTLTVNRIGTDDNGQNPNVNIKSTRSMGGFTYQPTYHNSTADVVNHTWAIIHYGETYNFLITSSNTCGTWSGSAMVTSDENIIIVSSFPNPTDSELTVQVGDEGEVKEIFLFSNDQEIVYMAETKANDIVIPTGHLSEGRYVMKINKRGRSYIEHIIVDH